MHSTLKAFFWKGSVIMDILSWEDAIMGEALVKKEGKKIIVKIIIKKYRKNFWTGKGGKSIFWTGEINCS